MAEDNGRVMVGETVLKSDAASHGFVRDASGHFDIIDVPGTNVPCTFAYRINESGDIVGYFANVNSVDDCNNYPHVDGFLLRKSNYTVIKVPGAIDSGELGTNDDGVLVGFFLDKKGVHGFKAVPVN